jgi:tripartite-type tricarboxylate transporter receptor subunit TctC
MKKSKRFIGKLAAATLASTLTLWSSAQTFPSKPINLVVAYPAGSSTDTLAREMAQALTPVLGQSVVVVNRAGAGGVTGTDMVARSTPDGYTLGWGTSSQLVMNPGVYKTLPFDIDKDISQVGLVIKIPLALGASSKVPATLKEFISQAKAAPKKFNYGSAGAGSVSHVMSEVFLRQTGIDVVHVPYKGAAPALVDLAAGQVDFVVDTMIAMGPFVDQGRVHILGVGGDKRSASRPNVPTFAEQGFGDFSAYSWGSVFAPAKTPAAIIEKLNQAISVAMQTPAFKARVAQVGGELLGPDTAQAANTFAERERERWLPLIRKAGIVAE